MFIKLLMVLLLSEGPFSRPTELVFLSFSSDSAELLFCDSVTILVLQQNTSCGCKHTDLHKIQDINSYIFT